ncbi:EF hand domain containing protein [Acanthamoeba castellanii str. Neff]|uniref:EF hand domain containing protein n=1 Tax=Acanthamoeba castellanii (strain ATCC 30010 / Neff) TaxID=1257118 RepID=L8H6I5_ACACF|nr:EF hand domain containing protein [Acanthamoeba castellanii str. Neff]ELR21094.1 EF hand domain containing protein [Acanthamoeba castellanii str. Neff]
MYGGGGGGLTVSRIAFNKHDKDKSGCISRSEFHDLCYSMGHYLTPAEAEHAAKMIDKDGSGSITYDEFQKWWRTDNRFQNLQLSEDEMARSRRHTHADLTKHGLTTKTFDQCFRELDSDGSGRITYNEYIQWLIRIGSLKLKPID